MRISSVSPIVGRSTTPRWLAWSLLLMAVPALASADDEAAQNPSRAAALAAERDKKATETSPPERSFVERALYRYDNSYGFSVFGNWHGLHLAGGDFPAGAGTKFGVGFKHAIGSSDLVLDPTRPNRMDVDAKAAYSTNGYGRAVVALNARDLGGRPFTVRVQGQHYEFPQEDFFGLGQDSRKGDRTDYLLRSTEVGAVLQWKPAKLVDVAGGVSYLSPRIGSGTDSRFPSTEQLFDPATLPGFSKQADFLRSDVSFAFDWRENPLHPHAGGRYTAQLSNFRDQELNGFDFRRVEVDVQQYVPLPNRYRTVALRASAVLTDADAGHQVPFFYQPTLGGSHVLRGFREFRFRDRNSLAMTAEYRWEAWWALDGALFVDAGTVAANRRDLTFRDLDVSYGVGFRVHSNSAFAARLDLAFSREGFIPLLRFEHVF
jgi:hypothetical protein